MTSDTRIEELLDRWEAAQEHGQGVSPEELCSSCPELLPSLRQKIEALLDINRRLSETIPLPENNDPVLPDALADYEILAVLGGGGMGTVYKARQHGTDQIVALKMIRSDWIGRMSDACRAEAIEQFHVEAKAAARLKHPNIVKVLHMGQTGGAPYYAMEIVEGESLSDTLKQDGPLGNRRAAQYLVDVAGAIHEAHRHGILHRDIKPQNLLRDNVLDAAKVADFGLAELRADVDSSANPSGSDSYRGAGTLLYMAPELLEGSSESTVSSDIYSLGATLYELLVGRPPFEGSTPNEVRKKIIQDEPVPPSKLNSDVSRQLDQVCMKCLEKRPQDRFASSAELMQLLREYLDAPKLATQMATISKWVFIFAIIIFSINFAVFRLLQAPFVEPLVWLLVFAMYPPLLFLVAIVPRRPERDNRQARLELWSILLGKLFAAACISIGLSIALAPDARLAIQMSYPMFAGLSGMASFALGASFWRGFYACAFGFWILGVTMMFGLEWAPLAYGTYTSVGILAFGVYLHRLSREFG